jgi:uncharacterized SAM-binding protein YcdF (DUF218 family)
MANLHGAPERMLLSSETESRVATGVAAWHQHPSAKLVMAGTETSDPQLAGRMVSLMRDRAVSSGVPAEGILLDPRSSNTREHAQRLREMSGITRATRVGVATSFWHMRRAARVFRRYFDTVILYPTNPVPATRSIASYLPNARALVASTAAIHEWIGIAWYAAHDARDDAFSAVRGAPRLQR